MTDKYCPTRGGSFTGYEPQWLHPVDGWIATPMQFITGGVLRLHWRGRNEFTYSLV